MVFRDLDLVVVATSSPEVSDQRHGHRRRLLDLVSTQVVAPVRGGDGVITSPTLPGG